jgi:hypothetical protein
LIIFIKIIFLISCLFNAGAKLNPEYRENRIKIKIKNPRGFFVKVFISLASFLKSPLRRLEKACRLSRAVCFENRIFLRFKSFFAVVYCFFDQKNGEKSAFSDQTARRTVRIEHLTFHFI